MNISHKQMEAIENTLGNLAHEDVYIYETSNEAWMRLGTKSIDLTLEEIKSYFPAPEWSVNEESGFICVRNNFVMQGIGKLCNYIEEIGDTSLMGSALSTFAELCDVFGQPNHGPSDDGKVSVEWALQFVDGTIATIYDWKEEATPKGIYEWHIGGKNQDAVKWVEFALNLARDKKARSDRPSELLQLNFVTWAKDFLPQWAEDSGAECDELEECECEFLYPYEWAEIEEDEDLQIALKQNRIWAWLENGTILSLNGLTNLEDKSKINFLLTEKPYTQKTIIK